jgi:hypothetical protein
MAMTRKGNMYSVYGVFAYLKAKHNSRLKFDPTYPRIHHVKFKADQDLEPFYENVREAIPPNAPKAPWEIGLFCDCLLILIVQVTVKGRSRTGFNQMVNMALVNVNSKTHSWIEGSTYGSEFVAAKAAMEASPAL